jgi:hypothetical protein
MGTTLKQWTQSLPVATRESLENELESLGSISDPTSEDLLRQATLTQALGLFPQSMAPLERALELDSNHICVLEALAWLKATDATVFDPEEALELAKRANQLARAGDAEIRLTLAVAQAANGLFEDAYKTGMTTLATGKLIDPVLATKLTVHTYYCEQQLPQGPPLMGVDEERQEGVPRIESEDETDQNQKDGG